MFGRGRNIIPYRVPVGRRISKDGGRVLSCTQNSLVSVEEVSGVEQHAKFSRGGLYEISKRAMKDSAIFYNL